MRTAAGVLLSIAAYVVVVGAVPFGMALTDGDHWTEAVASGVGMVFALTVVLLACGAALAAVFAICWLFA